MFVKVLYGLAAVCAVGIVVLCIRFQMQTGTHEAECLRSHVGPPIYVKIGIMMIPIEQTVCDEYARTDH